MWLCLVIKSLYSSLEENPDLGKYNEAPFSCQWLKAKTQFPTSLLTSICRNLTIGNILNLTETLTYVFVNFLPMKFL